MGQGAERQWMPRATRWVAVLVGTVVSVSACTGGGPEPGPSSTTPTTTAAQPTTSPSPTPTAPAEPAKPSSWTTGSDEAAVDAAAYFMDLYNYVIATGDLTEWDALSDPACEFCADTHDRVAAVYVPGGRFEGGLLTAEDALRRLQHGAPHPRGATSYHTQATSEFAPDGALSSSYGPESGYVIVDVGFTGDRWRLVAAQWPRAHGSPDGSGA